MKGALGERLLSDAREGVKTMLRSMNDLEGYTIRATDGLIGHVRGLLL